MGIHTCNQNTVQNIDSVTMTPTNENGHVVSNEFLLKQKEEFTLSVLQERDCYVFIQIICIQIKCINLKKCCLFICIYNACMSCMKAITLTELHKLAVPSICVNFFLNILYFYIFKMT